jgi:magnesium-protoporphyrin O-methyltransferase
MDGCGCDRGFEIFDRRNADEDLARYRQRGPDRTTTLLLDMVRAAGVRGGTLLDIGAGIGVIDHELVRDGLGHATLVDASAPSLAAAREEARRRGQIDRLEFVDGDFVSRASSIDVADIVTLDRVICCYPDVTSLVRESASRARAMYALVLPRDRWLVRLGARLENIWFRLRRLDYRAYAHPNSLVDALVSQEGLSVRSEARTFFWRVVLYDRSASSAPGATATA